MDKLKITGGVSLKGTIKISGAKNACLPILSASILFDSPFQLENVPHLNDVTTMLQLLNRMGAHTMLNERMGLEIDATQLQSTEAPYELVKTMRASVLVLGPLLAKYGSAKVSLPGGCAIGSRPIDLHIDAMQKLGAIVEVENGFVNAHVDGRLKGAEIDFPVVSVTGTENVIMAATLAEGVTIIRNAAMEPEVTDLINCLNEAGAKIEGANTDTLTITGVDSLKQTEAHTIISDRIETSTYLIAAAMTRGHVTLQNTDAQYSKSLITLLRDAGADITIGDNSIELNMHDKLPQSVSTVTAPYPGFPTDIQAQLMAMNTVAHGKSTIVETIFEKRFMHVDELRRMGARIELDGNTANIHGDDNLQGAPVMATDLRASASLVLAGLVAEGDTIVDRIYHIDRGYECIEEKLAQLGAKIKRIS